MTLLAISWMVADPPVSLMARSVVATTGMRRGDVLGLRWNRVDLDAGRASIQQAVVCVGHEVCFSEPKTKKGQTVGAARSHHRGGPASAPQGADHTRPGRQRIFRDDAGSPLDPESVSPMFSRRVQSSGLPRMRFHDLRHTFATLALSANVPLKVVSTSSGTPTSRSPATPTGNVIPSMQEDATGRVAALVFGP